MPYDKRIPLELQLLRVGCENSDDTAIFACTTSTSYYTPSYFIGDARDAPEMMDVMGALEQTLHDLIDNGCTLPEACDVMGLSELHDDIDEDDGGQVYIDLGVGFDGELLSIEKLDPASSDIRSLLSEQQIVNVVMAFDNLESDDRLGAAERFAAADYTCWQAQEVCKAYQLHLPKWVIDVIANPKLKPSEMRSLIGIAMVSEPAPDNGLPMRRALAAVLSQFDKVVPKLHLIESLAETASKNGVPFDERWCSLDAEQVVSLRTAIASQAPTEALEAFAGGRYPSASMDCITVAYCGGNGRMDASALLDPAYNPAQLWCLSSAVASHARGDISDAQLDFLRNPELSADLMNAVRNCFTYYGMSVEQAKQNVVPGIEPMLVYDLLDADAGIEQPLTGGRAQEHPATALSEESRASREASGHLEADKPQEREAVNQEKE